MVYIIPKFLALHFDENFMKIQTKTPKLKMHKSVNENMFSFTFYSIFHEFLRWAIKATNMLHFTLLISDTVFNPFKMVIQL